MYLLKATINFHIPCVCVCIFVCVWMYPPKHVYVCVCVHFVSFCLSEEESNEMEILQAMEQSLNKGKGKENNTTKRKGNKE